MCELSPQHQTESQHGFQDLADMRRQIELHFDEELFSFEQELEADNPEWKWGDNLFEKKYGRITSTKFG
jgi:hypothetical protein